MGCAPLGGEAEGVLSCVQMLTSDTRVHHAPRASGSSWWARHRTPEAPPQPGRRLASALTLQDKLLGAGGSSASESPPLALSAVPTRSAPCRPLPKGSLGCPPSRKRPGRAFSLSPSAVPWPSLWASCCPQSLRNLQKHLGTLTLQVGCGEAPASAFGKRAPPGGSED